MKPILLAVLTALALPMAALAVETPSTAASASSAAQAPAPDVEAKKICKLERKTGSNMSVRVCRTPEQMAAERDAARDALTHGKGSNRSEPVTNGSF